VYHCHVRACDWAVILESPQDLPYWGSKAEKRGIQGLLRCWLKAILLRKYDLGLLA
jgi:hypothetical protein